MILIYPDARLRREAREVDLGDADLPLAIRQLELALGAGPGAVGIAAPQIGLDQRMIIVDCTTARRPCLNHGRLVMLNPVIEDREGRVLGREGCLSVPDWVGMVPRSHRILVSFQTPEGATRRIESLGFEARVIQHEIDHLDGILFIDRVVSVRDLVRRP